MSINLNIIVLGLNISLVRDIGENVQDKYDTILLHSASYHGRPEMLRILLDHGVRSNAKNPRGETALHVVSRGSYEQQDGARVAQLLLERGVDVNVLDKVHDSPIHSASYYGKLEITRVLLDHGAKANAENDRGETPLHQVSQGEYESQVDGVRIAQLLLDRGVDVNAQDKNGATPLHLASWCGKLEVARLLLERAALQISSVRTLLHVGVEGEYDPKNIIVVITHKFCRTHRGLECATKKPRNSTTLCMLTGKARDRTTTSRPQIGRES